MTKPILICALALIGASPGWAADLAHPCGPKNENCRRLTPAEIATLQQRSAKLLEALPVADSAKWPGAIPGTSGDEIAKLAAEHGKPTPSPADSWSWHRLTTSERQARAVCVNYEAGCFPNDVMGDRRYIRGSASGPKTEAQANQMAMDARKQQAAAMRQAMRAKTDEEEDAAQAAMQKSLSTMQAMMPSMLAIEARVLATPAYECPSRFEGAQNKVITQAPDKLVYETSDVVLRAMPGDSVKSVTVIGARTCDPADTYPLDGVPAPTLAPVQAVVVSVSGPAADVRDYVSKLGEAALRALLDAPKR